MRFALLLFTFFLSSSVFSQRFEWKKLNTEPYKGKQDDIYFINESTGWYINGHGKIYKTTNGGNDWQLQLDQKGSFFRCLAFIDSLTGFVGTVGTEYFPGVTDTIPLYKTTDGGKTWAPVAYTGPYIKGLCSIDIIKEQFINHGEIGYKYHIYAVGRVGSPANILISHDGGNHFFSQSMSAHCDALYDIKMFDKTHGFAAASVGENETMFACVLKTEDGGKHWEKVYQSARPYETCWKLSFPSKDVGYGTIQSYDPDTNKKTQVFIKSEDGGKTWRESVLCQDYNARPFGVGFVNEDYGYIGTKNSGYKTENGGKSWEKIDLGMACNKIRILKSPIGKVYGYAIGVGVYKLSSYD